MRLGRHKTRKDPFEIAKRWIASRRQLLEHIENLSEEIVRIRARNVEIQKAKAQAEARVESLRREKDALREKAAVHKKAAQAAQHTIDHQAEKIIELRAEVDRLKNINVGRNKGKR